MCQNRFLHASVMFGGLLLAATVPTGKAAADIVSMYTSQAAFDAATGNLSTDNFSSYSPTNYASLSTTNGAVLTASGGSNPYIGITSGSPSNQYGTGQFAFAGNALALDAAMPTGATAVAANFNLSGTGTVIVSTTIGSQSFSVPNPGQNALGFAGFVSGSTITNVSYISSSGFPEDIDNLAIGHASQGSSFGVSITGLPSDITLSNATLLVADSLSNGSTTYQTIPMGTIADGGGFQPPPPVYVPNQEGTGPIEVASQSINAMAEYTNSDTGATGVALLVADAGGRAPPPDRSGSFNSVFNAASEGTILQELQNLNSGGTSAPNLNNFMQNNPNYMFQVEANNSISDGAFYSYSNGTQIGSLDASVVVTPEPSALVLLAIGTAALWFAARRRKG